MLITPDASLRFINIPRAFRAPITRPVTWNRSARGYLVVISVVMNYAIAQQLQLRECIDK